MKNLTATLCLTISVLLGSAGVSWSADWEQGKSAYLNNNYILASEELTPLADAGHAGAQISLALIFSKGGNGVSKNDAKSAKYYELAAKQGVLTAQYNTAANYLVGRGVLQDYQAAQYWYRKCAEQNSVTEKPPVPLMMCRHFLAGMYYEGTEIPQDYSKAKFWFLKAAELDSHSSMVNLGVMYANGEGVLQDRASAHMWFNIAASMGAKGGAKYRDQIAKSMPPAQIADAQKLARECVRKKYKGC
jgi:uncharacterized protein